MNKILFSRSSIEYSFLRTLTSSIFEFIKLVEPHTIDLVTADGGFDFSIDFNKQEILAYRMIFCEVVTALAVQKKGGTFICKIFDIYTEITIQFIYLLGFFYEEIYITNFGVVLVIYIKILFKK